MRSTWVLQLSCGCQVILHAFHYYTVERSQYYKFSQPTLCLLVATQKVAMDTLQVSAWFSLLSGSTILSGTIPQAHQLLIKSSFVSRKCQLLDSCYLLPPVTWAPSYRPTYSPFTVFPLKTMLLNCSVVSSACFLADINDIFVILVLCGIWAESDKCGIFNYYFLVLDKWSIEMTIIRDQNNHANLSLTQM